MVVVAALELVIFVWALKNWRQDRGNVALLLITIMLSLQWADALIFGIGRWVGEGDLLEGLNRLRTTWFFLTSPLLLLASILILRNADFAWLKPKAVLVIAIPVSIVYMAMDGYVVANAEFYPACAADTLRYVLRVAPEQICAGHQPVETDGYFSPMLLLSTGAVVFTGLVVWIRRGWPWLGAASLLFIGGFVLMPTDVVGPFLSFPLDGLMAAALVFTAIRFSPKNAPVGL